MHVRYCYNWGYFHPITCGTDVVATNHFDYFRERGWTVDCVIVNDARKAQFADEFRRKYDWLDSITLVDLPSVGFGMRELLFGYEHAARRPHIARALARPADLCFTNYVFSTPVLRHLPRSCKRILETHDMLATQFAMAERHATAASGAVADPLAGIRESYVLRTELELYRLYDHVIMINEQELAFVRSRGVANASYVPQAYAPIRLPVRAEYEHDLIFVGSAAPINTLGIGWFYRHVYIPYLWRHRVRLVIVGGVCAHLDCRDAYVTLLPQVNGSLADLYAATRIAIGPVFEGTGLPIKTLEGLAMGRAMVLTPVGARGFDDAANAYVKVDMKESPRETAEVILQLLSNPDRRKKLEQAASAYVRRCFSRERYFEAMDRVVEAVASAARRSA